MIYKNKIFKNASWIIGGRIGQSILSLIVTMLTARYLGPSNYGLISYVASIVAFFSPIAQLGLGNIQVQEIVSKPEEEGTIVGTSLLLSIIAAIACYIGVISFVMVANAGETDTLIVCALYGVLLFFQGAELIQYWFQAKYFSKFSSVVSLVAYFIVSIYKVFLLVTGKSIYWFAISNTLDYCIILVILIIVFKRIGRQHFIFSLKMAGQLLEKSKYYIVANLMVIVFTQTDRVMLKLMLDDASTGYYTAAITCAGLANFFFIAIIDSTRPKIFENYQISYEKFSESVSTLYSIVIYISLMFCIGVTLFASVIIYIIYGHEYSSAVQPLRLVVWYTTFSYIGSVRNIWILAVNQQKWLWVINVSGALANVILNLIFIPSFGVSGAAAASLLTQIFSNIIVSYLIKGTRENTYIMIKGMDVRLIIRLFKRVK